MVETWKLSTSATDSDLALLCEARYNHDKFTIQEESRSTAFKTEAPENTVALVIDFSSSGGKGFINIGEDANNNYGVSHIARIGSNGPATKLDIISWDSKWRYYTSTDVKIKYVIKS